MNRVLGCRMSMGRRGGRIVALGAAAVAAVMTGCKKSDSSSSAAAAAAPAPEVVAVKAIEMDVPDYRYYPGITQAVLTADIVARVEGFLLERNFVEGDDVKINQRLYLIQQDQYEASLASSLASLAEAQANLSFQRFNRDETALAMSKGAASQYEMDQAQAQFEEAQAQVASAKANIVTAELNLEYTDVTAPFPGRVGNTQVNVGNLVGPNINTNLTTLVMLDPMRVVFEPAGTELREFFAAQADGEVDVQITVAGADDKVTTYDGLLDLINNEVTQSTSTFLSRAVFPNPKKDVLPGLFVNVRVKLRMMPNTVVIPADAVRSEPRSQYVFVVDDKDEVQRRTVVGGVAYQGFRVIRSGLKSGESVVVQYDQSSTRAGMKVTVKLEDAKTFVKNQNAAAAAAAAAAGGLSTGSSSATEQQKMEQYKPETGDSTDSGSTTGNSKGTSASSSSQSTDDKKTGAGGS